MPGIINQFVWTAAGLALLGAGCGDSQGGHLTAYAGMDAAYAQDSGNSQEVDDAVAPQQDATTAHLDAQTPEAGAVDSADASHAFLTCPPQELPTCSRRSGVEWEVLLDAAELGAGARFTAMGREAVLVQGGEAPWRLIRLQGTFDDVNPLLRTTWTFPPGDWLALDVTSAAGARFNGVFALVCEANMTACHLVHGGVVPDAGAAVLVELAGSALPAEIQPRGLVFDPALDVLCVFGNALVCFQNDWTTAIASDPGIEIHEVVSQDQESRMVAIGAGGRWWKRAVDSTGTPTSWSEQPSIGSGDDLVGASVAEERVVVFGKRAWWAAEGTSAFERCALQDELIAVLLHAGTPFTEIVQASGEVLTYQPNVANRSPGSWCRSQRVDFGAGPVLQLANVPCGIISNPRVLTASKLVGTKFCAIE